MASDEPVSLWRKRKRGGRKKQDHCHGIFSWQSRNKETREDRKQGAVGGSGRQELKKGSLGDRDAKQKREGSRGDGGGVCPIQSFLSITVN